MKKLTASVVFFRSCTMLSDLACLCFWERLRWNVSSGGSRISQRGRQPLSGCQHTIWPIVPANCMEIKFWLRGKKGTRPLHPLNPQLVRLSCGQLKRVYHFIAGSLESAYYLLRWGHNILFQAFSSFMLIRTNDVFACHYVILDVHYDVASCCVHDAT